MKALTAALAASTALTIPMAAQATEITLNTQLKSYSGKEAYLAYYLTDEDGAYVRTLWLAAGKSRWWNSLQAWYSATGGAESEISGVTGASVGSGQSLNVTVEIEDALIDAGYQIRVDTAVEHNPSVPAEIVVPLTSEQAGQEVSGRGYITTFSFDM